MDGLTIGPNPVEDYLNFNNETQKDFEIIITNTLGQTLKEAKITRNSETSLDVTEYSKGVYFIYANGIFVHKFVVK